MTAPLVPEIISNEFNLVIAFLVGIGFGFTLEQAGFSSTKKLVGLFYGYDFTVLKVFFTAGITAMVGLLLLNHLGIIEMQRVYINPTFVNSALIGGAIMGGGFIIGGFCPGTSVCAAAVGKIDAMFFLLGGFIGIFVFTEVYPAVEHLYKANPLGNITFYEQIGLSKHLFALLLTMVAILAFVFTTLIENNINHRKTVFTKSTVIRNASAALIPLLIILVVMFTPDYNQRIDNKIAQARREKKCSFKEISADKLAFELVNNHYTINLIDVRSPAEYKKYHLPLAINIPLDSIKNREYTQFFKQKYKQNIFYSDTDTITKKACLTAHFIGESENYILSKTMNEFKNMFFDIQPPIATADKNEFNTYQFRLKAGNDLINLNNHLKKFNEPVKKKTIKVQGGCS